MMKIPSAHLGLWNGAAAFFVAALFIATINLMWLIPTLHSTRSAAADLSMAHAQRVRREVDGALQILLNDMEHAASEITLEPERTRIVLARLLRTNETFSNIALAGRDGVETLRLDRAKVITAADLRDHVKASSFYLALTGAPSFGNIFLTESAEPRVVVSMPLVALDGGIKGVLVAEANLHEFVNAVETPDLAGSSAYLVDEKGFRIISGDISELPERRNVLERRVVSSIVVDGQSSRGLGPSDAYEDDDGTVMFAVGVPISSTGWGIVVERERAAAFASEYQLITLAGLVTLLGAAVIGVIVVNNRIIRGQSSKLHELLGESYTNAKILIRKDRELTGVNEGLKSMNAELEDVGKILVRRDLALSEANRRLEEMDDTKSEFVSVAAHQLRTPLTGVRWSLHALLDKTLGPLTPKQEAAVRDGLEVSLHAIDLVNNLLDVARIEETRSGFEFTRASVLPILEQALERAQSDAQAKDIDMSMKAPKRVPVLSLDVDKIGMVMDNLLSNALKYTEPCGTVGVHLTVGMRDITVSVADTGMGIPQEQQHRVFTQFFRAENARLAVTSGSGLGLYLVKNIVEKHGGKVSFKSKVGTGTTFTFTLPQIK